MFFLKFEQGITKKMIENKKSKKWKELSVWISIEILWMFQKKTVCDFLRICSNGLPKGGEKKQNSFLKKFYVK